MILTALLAAAAIAQPKPVMVVSRTFAVRARVEATCTASARDVACDGAKAASPLARRYEPAANRVVIEY